jgi:hypothetical protein
MENRPSLFFYCGRCSGLELAHCVDSRQRGNSVAFRAKRTFSANWFYEDTA